MEPIAIGSVRARVSNDGIRSRKIPDSKIFFINLWFGLGETHAGNPQVSLF